MSKQLFLALLLSSCFAAQAETPPNPINNFNAAAKIARDQIYVGHETDIYCACKYTANETGTSGKVDAESCGYIARKNVARGKIIEWEHIVPAFYFGRTRACWKTGDAQCVKSNGTRYKGRECCGKVDPEFKRIEADLHNLAPAVGELNADRSNKPYGLVRGEPRAYGQCKFEVGGTPAVAEPPDNVRGDTARTWMYMIDVYGVEVSEEELTMFRAWSHRDPVSRWERERDLRIKGVQGNSNPYVVTEP